MTLKKPYFRIMRPNASVHDSFFAEYIFDHIYANDRTLLCRAYDLIINDLKKLFEYIEPSDDNLNTYSHRTYELILRASTEFETNCRRILEANSYFKSKNLNIEDYYRINKSSKLADYEVILEIWRPERKIIQPFENWNQNHSLSWYQDYNSVKHDRHKNFEKASLENTLNAIAGLSAILFSQFGIYSFTPYQRVDAYNENDDGSVYGNNSMFSIKFPENWDVNEKYGFHWELIKNEQNPFQKFQFD